MADQPKVTVKPSRKTPEPKPDNREALDALFTMPSPEETPDDVAVDNLLLDFKGMESAEVRIHRVLPNNKYSYIETVHPSEFRFDDLRDKHGGGNFRLYVYGLDEDGRKQLRAAPYFTVEKPKETITPQVMQQNTSDIAQVVAQSMAGLGQLMTQGFENIGKLIIQNQQPQIDPMIMQQNMLQNMLTMKQLIGGDQKPVEQPGALEKALEMLQKGMELGKGLSEVKGEANTTDVLLEVIRNFGPPLMAGMAQQQAARPPMQPTQQTPAPPIPPVPPLQPSASNQPVPESDDMNMIQKQRMKMGVQFMVDAAKQNLDHLTYANLVLDTLSDEEIDALFFNPEVDPIKVLAEVNPEVAQYHEWFSGVVNEVRNALTDETPEGISEQSTLAPEQNAPDKSDIGESLPNT